jgi:purine-binding chemotaxis protein CheW
MANEKPSHTAASRQTAQLIVFRLGGEEYALEIGQIKEVVPTPPVAKVPLAPPYIEGIANIRGNILAIMNLEKKFELPASSVPAARTYTLVVEQEEWQVGFLVHEVPNTLSVPAAQIDESPSIVQDRNRERGYIKGIVKAGERLIILLDLPGIVSRQEAQAAVLP